MPVGRLNGLVGTSLPLIWTLACSGCTDTFENQGAAAATQRVPIPETVRSDRKQAAVALTQRGMQEQLKSSVSGLAQVDLTWKLTDKAIGTINGADIWRSEDRKTWVAIAHVHASVTRYSDSNLKPNVLYFYCLSAAGTPATPFYGNDAFTITIPKTPHSLAARPFDSDVILTWSKVAEAHDGYEILGSADGKSFHVVADVDADTTSYRDWSAADGVTDYYKVCAFGLFGNFAPTEIASATPIARIRERDKTPYDELVYQVPHGHILRLAIKTLVENDVDPNNDPVLKLGSFTQPSHGSVSREADGTLLYTANKQYVGSDSFTYTLSDQYKAPCDAATITVSVTNAMPEAISGRIAVRPAINDSGRQLSHPKTVSGTLEARDADGDSLTFSAKVISGPGHFTLDDPTKGSYTFVPSESDHAPCLIEFTASDGIKTGNKASLIFPGWAAAGGSVEAAGLAASSKGQSSSPIVLQNRRYSIYQGGTLQVYASDGLLRIAGIIPASSTLPARSVDPTPVEPPRHGSLSLRADGSFTYTAESSGSDWFTYRLTDGVTPADYATVFIDVDPIALAVWFEPPGIIPAAPFHATLHLKYPSNLPSGSLVVLSVPGNAKSFLKVFDHVPGKDDSGLLFGGITAKESYTWTVGGSPKPPSAVYVVGPDTKHDAVTFSLSVTLGQSTFGAPLKEESSTRPSAP